MIFWIIAVSLVAIYVTLGVVESREIVPRPCGLSDRDLAESRVFPNIKTRQQAAAVTDMARGFRKPASVMAAAVYFVGGNRQGRLFQGDRIGR